VIDMDSNETSPPRRYDRRSALHLLAGIGAVAVVGCSSDEATTGTTSSSAPSSSSATSASTTAPATTVACEPIPEEMAGPFPGDGTNGPDYLAMDGAVRQDIRTSLGSDQLLPGATTTLELTVVDAAAGCAPLAGAAVHAWHCDAVGRYSMYEPGTEDETFCRGLQVADDEGRLSFTTVFPGCYPGRWPHVHLAVYGSVADATGGGTPIATTQLALPREASEAVYAQAEYGPSAGHLAELSLDTDGIFADGYDDQLAAVSGRPAADLTASLTVAV
jgi:protocatechuate 3,4-dioxygenase beta subunit